MNNEMKALIYLVRCSLRGEVPSPAELDACGAADDDIFKLADEQGVLVPAASAMTAMCGLDPAAAERQEKWQAILQRAQEEAGLTASVGEEEPSESGEIPEEDGYLAFITNAFAQSQGVGARLSFLADLFLYVTRRISRSFRWDYVEAGLAETGAAAFEQTARNLSLAFFGEKGPEVREDSERLSAAVKEEGAATERLSAEEEGPAVVTEQDTREQDAPEEDCAEGHKKKKAGRYFGTDGFRGEANIDLTAPHAFRIGRFLGWYYGELRRERGEEPKARIVIGKDTRRSSYMFEYSLVGGIVASGADAFLLHVTTTPSVSYVARTEDFDCGVMISASHNPYYDNGIKLLNSDGEKMDETTIGYVEDYLDGELEIFGRKWDDIPLAERDQIGCTVDYVAGRNRYVGYLISLGMFSFKGYKIGLDCANGSAWNIARTVFDALGAKTYAMGVEPNGFNINQGVGSTHIEALQRMVVEKGLDVGFAYDGDADRCLCVDENGQVVNGDHIMYIYGKYMKERGKLLKNTVVTTVMSNIGLFKAFEEAGIDSVQTKVGDKYVYEYMSENGCRIGGEQSGHIIFSKYANTGDGILTSLKVMLVMIDRKKKLSELAAPLTIYPQVLKNIRVTDKKKAQNDPAVQDAVKAAAEALGTTGRILVRESGTEPVVRVMVEAESAEDCEKYVDSVIEVIRERGYEV